MSYRLVLIFMQQLGQAQETIWKTSESNLIGSTTAPTVKLSSIEYSESSGFDKLKIKSGTAVACRDKRNVELCNVDATNGFITWTNLLLNKYVVGGARDIGAYNNKHAASDIIIADYKNQVNI